MRSCVSVDVRGMNVLGVRGMDGASVDALSTTQAARSESGVRGCCSRERSGPPFVRINSVCAARPVRRIQEDRFPDATPRERRSPSAICMCLRRGRNEDMAPGVRCAYALLVDGPCNPCTRLGETSVAAQSSRRAFSSSPYSLYVYINSISACASRETRT